MAGVVMAEVTLIDALTMAMAWELEHDSRVVVLGEDVGVNGGRVVGESKV